MKTFLRRSGAGLLVTLLAVLAMAAPAMADSIAIRKVDTTAFPVVKVQVLVNGQTPDPKTFNLVEDKQYIQTFTTTATGKSDLPVGIALVIDTSGSMKQADKMAQAKLAALTLVKDKREVDQIAIVGFGNTASLLQPFTADVPTLVRVIGGLVPAGETALYDGVALGAGQFQDRKDIQANLVVISDGKDTRSTKTVETATGVVTAAKAAVFGLGLAGGADYDSGPLQQLANRTGGTYLETRDPARLAELGTKVQRSLANQYELDYTSKATTAFDIQVSVGALTALSRANNPGQVTTASQTAPKPFQPTMSPGPLRSRQGLYVLAALAFVAVLLLAFGVVSVVMRAPSSLDAALLPYSDRGPEYADEDGGMAQSDLLKRAVAATEKLARDQGLLAKIERKLEIADIKLRAAELLFFTTAAVLLLAVVGGAVAGPAAAFLILFIGLLIPPAVLSFLASRRKRKFEGQLPDTLTMLAGTLRAGYSLLQGVDAVAREVQEPMGKELRRVLSEAQLGRDIDVGLEECAARMESDDFDWAVMAINIQREVGGNLSELLETVADTMLQRERLRRDVKSLTAEGRMSAIVIGLLPPGIALAFYFINPEYIGKLFTDSTGQLMLGVSVVWAAFGLWWMKKCIEIDV